MKKVSIFIVGTFILTFSTFICIVVSVENRRSTVMQLIEEAADLTKGDELYNPPRDIYGTQLRYTIEEGKTIRLIKMVSAGPDKEFYTSDDITENLRWRK